MQSDELEQPLEFIIETESRARPCEEAYIDEAGDNWWWAIEFDSLESFMQFVVKYESCTVWRDVRTNYIKLGESNG